MSYLDISAVLISIAFVSREVTLHGKAWAKRVSQLLAFKNRLRLGVVGTAMQWQWLWSSFVSYSQRVAGRSGRRLLPSPAYYVSKTDDY